MVDMRSFVFAMSVCICFSGVERIEAKVSSPVEGGGSGVFCLFGGDPLADRS